MTNGYRGDISIDDVSLTSGTCSGSSGMSGRTCGFEDTHICGYTQDHSDVFDWTRKSGSTSSTGTGPSNDHTYGTSQGHYMYIEASLPRKLGDTARLISPSYTDSQAMCVQFYYHMYGNSAGALNVYIQTNGQLGRAGFTMSNNGGNNWHLGEITVTSTTASAGYKVVFEGVRGQNARGDIAIDDIKFKTGRCNNPGECDFETGLCTWANTQQGDQFDWTIQQGQTSSVSTGPSTDHTVGDPTGHYMYIETSAPRLQGNIAWLVSETFPPTSASGRCISFWYNMYGQTIDTLTVLVRAQGVADQAIWSLTGSQGQQWMFANAPMSMASTSYQIVFQGRRGSAVTGDIAIDDISFTESSCGVRPSQAHPINGPTTLPTASTTPSVQGSFNCSFDTSFCGWTQDHTDKFDWTRLRGRTQSVSTGPSADHTSKRGYYVYTEASTPRVRGDKARLISPDVTVTGTQTKCLTFWYFMMGRNVAQLNVYAKSGLALPTTPVWRRSGSQGNQWLKAQVDLTAKSVFNVVFESMIGGAYGDIAVDDVGISDGSCTQGPVAMSCDFESTTVCGFQQDHTDQFDWTRGSGSTGSRGTGPSNDHTYGTSRGHYMFTEASGRHPGNKARLISPIYKGPSTPMCLKFWYHMYGSSGQTLNIYRLTRGVLGTPIWSKSGSQGNPWLVASVSIPVASQSNSPYQVVFEGIIGRTFRSDIGIDDFSITSGACPSEDEKF
ncbi:MAM and LDL-receptor class A domain-containing protein 1-like [Mizuhopecten yessoensis]|uniref:MAM and LDL-receptor class A domain-containing protein 1-like n=1 Tax=Mizuhopecten yessoensis TaxID=6573 RepID=UPI000B45CFC3|nr:MAM and LDL-receptor class A domain-containing protein 1-like [Mizuhopecten yessoensis]